MLSQHKTKRPRVLIFGGSFNPPTFAHYRLIETALAETGYDELWVMPSHSREDKRIAVDPALRLEMTRTLLEPLMAHYPNIKVTDFEVLLGEPTNTYRTWRHLCQSFPKCEFTFFAGSDSFASLGQWTGGEHLRKRANWLVAARGGAIKPKGLPSNVSWVRWPEAEPVSSTQVRVLVSRGQPVDKLTSKAVVGIIREQGLYKS